MNDIGENKSKNVGLNETYIKWKNWDEEFGLLERCEESYFRKELKKVFAANESGKRVLEIGFGNGKFLKYCKTVGWDIEGLEKNVDLVQKARAAGYAVRCSGSIEDCQRETYDLVAAFDVFEHLSAEETISLLLEIKRILKKGGFCLLRFPNGDSPLGLKNQNGDVTHQQFIGSSKIRYFSTKTGFQIAYLGRPATVIWCRSFKKFMHGLIAVPTKAILNFVLRFLLLEGAKINYLSENYTVVLKSE